MLKIIQVGASSISDGLDPAKFEVTLAPDTAGFGELRRLFAEKRPDVVHSFSSKAAVFAAKFAGVKKILYTPQAPDGTFELAAKLLGATIAAVPDAYLGGFPEAKVHEGLVAGSSGPMTRAHNPDAWVLLAQRLCDSRNGLSCLWIGGGEEEAAARVNLTNMNLLSKVEVTGVIPADAARERLRGLDLFVHYTLAGASPKPILDAMACGLPVVASDLPAHRAAVEHGVTGYLVKNEVELLERCQALLDDDDLRRRLGDAGRGRLLREFSRERQLAELSRLYSA
jgi:glycosyltransferase involved in cell wall biosynthesis